MAFQPQIAGIVARQVGSIQGKLVTQIQGRVLEVLSKFTNECPDSNELQKIVKIKNNLIKSINALERRIASIQPIVNRLDNSIRIARTAIQVIKSITVPTAIIPPQVGGLGIPINVLTRYSDALIRLNKLLDSLESDKAGILGVINQVSQTLTSLKNRLNVIDIAISQCSEANPQEILSIVQPEENTGSEGPPLTEEGEIDPRYQYKGFQLQIIQDPDSPEIAPRRYAIAKDRRGIVVIKGPSSFSSSVDVLLDEIKFRIDNQRFS